MSDKYGGREAVSQFRGTDDITGVLKDSLDDLEQDETPEIDIPERNSLWNQKLRVERIGDVNINGTWLHPIYAKIVNMLVKGRSPIIIIVGKEGSGKSMAGLMLAHNLHKCGVLRGTFNPEEQTVYDVISFLLLYRNTTRTAVMMDESNETLNSNDYNSDLNKAVAGTLRTQRKRENVNIFIGPEFKELDPRIRNKVDVLINMSGHPQERRGKVTRYEYKHDKRGNRGLDYKYTDYPTYKVEKVPDELKAAYDQVDNTFKGAYLDQMLVDAIKEQLERLEAKSTARI